MAPAPGNVICNMGSCSGTCIRMALAKKILPSSSYFCHFQCLLAGSVDPADTCALDTYAVHGNPLLRLAVLPWVSLLQQGRRMGRNGAFSRARLCAQPCMPHAQLGAVPLPAGSVLTPQPGSLWNYTRLLPVHTKATVKHQHCVYIFSTAIRIPYPTLVLGQPMLLSHANPLSSHSSQ